MKLLNKTLLYYVLISIPLLIAACFFSYYTVRGELMEATDEALQREQVIAENRITKGLSADIVYFDIDSLSTIRLCPDPVVTNNYKDTSIYDPFEEEMVKYRVLRSSHSSSGKIYLITIMKPMAEDDDLLESLSTSFVIILILLILVFFTVSWFLSRSIWKPFYKILEQLNAFDTRKNMNVPFENSSTKEFAQLSEALERMSQRIYADYLHQKEFTENASHEMQTPLAVLKANLSLLMQSQNLKQEEMDQLQVMENTIKKLGSLNKSLVLLSKIENKHFAESTTVNMNERITAALGIFKETAEAKKIAITTELQDSLKVQMDSVLADILITNLLQNSIRHNVTGGSINIRTDKNSLMFSNTGDRLSISEEELFIRFKKNDASKDSLGLGLSILKSITDIYKMKIGYSYSNNRHEFRIQFPKDLL